jgi:hypothetical protein
MNSFIINQAGKAEYLHNTKINQQLMNFFDDQKMAVY